MFCLGFFVFILLERLGAGLVGEVVGADGESVLGVVGVAAEVVAANESYCGDFALRGKREDIGGVEEEVLAEIACGAGFLAEVVVADEKEGGFGVIGDVADDAAELAGNVDAAKGHEVVDVVDDNKGWLEPVDESFDVAADGKHVVLHPAKHVKADEVEVILDGGMCDKLLVDLLADVRAVKAVDPEYFAGGKERCGQ